MQNRKNTVKTLENKPISGHQGKWNGQHGMGTEKSMAKTSNAEWLRTVQEEEKKKKKRAKKENALVSFSRRIGTNRAINRAGSGDFFAPWMENGFAWEYECPRAR